ncbi:PilN domain-containing protein [Thalassospira sp.]|uniref:PilN domain-containing protein n=1 Tax=Thalassospira sp. TaxID=1912094 RepID=UPI0032EE30D9
MAIDRYLDSVFRGVAWWWEGLLGCLPSRVVGFFTRENEIVFLTLLHNKPNVTYRFRDINGSAQDISTLESKLASLAKWGDGYELSIETNPDDVFCRAIELPATEVDRLEAYVHRHFSEICPYDPSTVKFQCNVRSANVDAGTVLVDVTFMFSDIVERCRGLRLGGELPRKVSIRTKFGSEDIRLHRWDEQPRTPVFKNGVIALVLLTAIVLPSATLHYAEAYFRSQYDDLLVEQEAIKRDVNEYMELVQSADELRAEELAINQTRGRSNTVSSVLDTVAGVLPIESWLQKLELHGDTIELTGYGEEAAKLTQVFDQVRVFHSVQLSAPIVPDPITGKDRFSIQMKIESDVIGASSLLEERF